MTASHPGGGVVAPSRDDEVVRAASEVVGGPAGAHVGAGRHGFWSATPVLVLAVTAVTSLALLLRQHCRATLWSSPDQFTHACYSDVPLLFTTSGMADGAVPYLDAAGGAHLQQPVGTGLLLWFLGLLAPGGDREARRVFDLAVLLIAVSLVVLVVAVVRLSGRRPWDAALVALSPVLVTASLVSLDAVAVTAAVLAVLAFSRHRPLAAGVLLGLAVAVRPMAAVVLVAVALLALRSGRWTGATRLAGATGAVWALVNVPIMVASLEGWKAYATSALHPQIGYGSLWMLPQVASRPLPAGAGRWVLALGLAAVLLGTALVVLAPRVRPRLPVVVLVLLVGIMLVSPAVPVQTSLWLLPFAALALPRWRYLLPWGLVEAAYGTLTWYYVHGLSDPARGLPAWLYAVLLVARSASWVWLAWHAVALARQPSLDPVRAPGDGAVPGRDDPAAGEIEGADDALVVRFA